MISFCCFVWFRQESIIWYRPMIVSRLSSKCKHLIVYSNSIVGDCKQIFLETFSFHFWILSRSEVSIKLFSNRFSLIKFLWIENHFSKMCDLFILVFVVLLFFLVIGIFSISLQLRQKLVSPSQTLDHLIAQLGRLAEMQGKDHKVATDQTTNIQIEEPKVMNCYPKMH